MSAMPAGWAELSDSPRVSAAPARAQRRTERRAALKLERRSRRRWAIAAGCGMAAAFGVTVGILDVLH